MTAGRANDYARAAEALRRARSPIAVTGAGISVESGIPDFRSAGGLWTRFPPEEYATIEAFLDDPDKVWDLFHAIGSDFAQVRPNAGHLALAELERMGKLAGVITQNIDNLHQAAGSTRVVGYHGNTARIVCVCCGAGRPFAPAPGGRGAPRCACGGPMKPDVVLFGEMIPAAAMAESERLVRACDAVVVVGTSATVYPAAAIPGEAKRHGAFVIECNIEPTAFTRSITDVFLAGPAGETLPELVRQLRG